jgi:FAD-linked oxidoreductase
MSSDTAARLTTPTLAWRNWDGNQRAVAAAVLAPASVDDVSTIVKRARETGHTVKAVGSGHSFTAIARTDDQRLELHGLADLISIDRTAQTVTVGAGMTLSVLNALLDQHGLALANLGDIDAQTVAGATSTGTHGTGAKHATLASFVEAVTLVTGTGEILRLDRESPLFPAARLGLGALGILTDVTLRCVDAFTVRADERMVTLADLLPRLDEHIATNDHVDLYWFPYTDRVQLKRNNVVPTDDRPLPRWRGWLDDELLANSVHHAVCRLGRAVPALVPTISAVSARALTERVYTGRSYEVFCTPRRTRFTEMEYAIPRAAFGEALSALQRIVARLPFKVQFPVEIRFTGPDDVWMSHGYGRENTYIAIHQYAGAPYLPYLEEFEKYCIGVEGRPHWGKLHYRDADSLRTVYPRFDDFLAVRDQLDPDRVFTNPHLAKVLGD